MEKINLVEARRGLRDGMREAAEALGQKPMVIKANLVSVRDYVRARRESNRRSLAHLGAGGGSNLARRDRSEHR